jgi:hypothetical protein
MGHYDVYKLNYSSIKAYRTRLGANYSGLGVPLECQLCQNHLSKHLPVLTINGGFNVEALCNAALTLFPHVTSPFRLASLA